MGERIVIVGAGPAGLAAAEAASGLGHHVTLIDAQPAAGGQIWRGGHPTVASRLRRHEGDRLFGCTVIDAPEPGQLLTDRGPVHYDKLILCTGARELFLPFPGWTLPGVVGAGGLQALAKSGLDVRNRRVVLAGCGPLLVAVADYLLRHGADVPLVAELTPRNKLLAYAFRNSRWLQAMRYHRALRKVRPATWVTRAAGEGGVREVEVTDGKRTWPEPCDYLAVGYGLVPNVELAQLLGCELDEHGFVAVDAQGRTSVPNVWCAGEPTGIAGVEAAQLGGTFAGADAAGMALKFMRRWGPGGFAEIIAEYRETFDLGDLPQRLVTPDTIVCRCEDVTYGRLRGCATQKEAKLATRCGMGACQGRVCGPINRILFGHGPNRPQPPLFPAPLSALRHHEQENA